MLYMAALGVKGSSSSYSAPIEAADIVNHPLTRAKKSHTQTIYRVQGMTRQYWKSQLHRLYVSRLFFKIFLFGFVLIWHTTYKIQNNRAK